MPFPFVGILTPQFKPTQKLYDPVEKFGFEGSIHSAQVIQALKHLLQKMPEGFLMIWDRARLHTSAETESFLADHPEICVEWLPPYAPDLNAEEYCHGQVKRRLRNATPTDDAEIHRMLDSGFAWLRRRPDLLLSCFHAAGLSVNRLWLD